MGAGVGDKAQELRSFFPATHVERERQSSLWALEALCSHGNSVRPEHPALAEHVGISLSTDPQHGLPAQGTEMQ